MNSRIVRAFVPVLLICLTGCSKYTVQFEVGDVINAWGGEGTRNALDVDIFCMTPGDMKTFPQIADRTLTSDAWFKMRDERDARLPARQIYSLRSGGAGDMPDTFKGAPLASARDAADGKRVIEIQIEHPNVDTWGGNARIAIFGRWNDRVGLRKAAALVVKPKGFDKNVIRVAVDREKFTCLNCKD